MEPKLPTSPLRIDLPADQIHTLISAAIIQGLDEKAKNELLATAVAHLIAPRRGEYGRAEDSPIVAAFKSCSERIAYDIVDKMLRDESGPYAAQIREVVSSALDKVLGDKTKLVDQLAQDIRGSLSRVIYRE
jgi:hypothetical protein